MGLLLTPSLLAVPLLALEVDALAAPQGATERRRVLRPCVSPGNRRNDFGKRKVLKSLPYGHLRWMPYKLRLGELRLAKLAEEVLSERIVMNLVEMEETRAFAIRTLEMEEQQGKNVLSRGVARRQISVENSTDARLRKNEERVKDALDRLDKLGTRSTSDTYAFFARQCGDAKDLSEGKRLHAHIMRTGYDRNLFVGNHLVTMYGRCGSPDDARSVFEKMPARDVVSWNAMITAYGRNGRSREALELFRRMDREGRKPNRITFVCVLDACASLASLLQCQWIHASIVDFGCEEDVVVGTALVNMYGKCGSPNDARDMFDKMPRRNVVSWNAMIAAYAQNGRGMEALELFRRMDLEGMKPDRVTFICILDACASLTSLVQGQEIHATIVDGGFGRDLVVGNAIVNMYGKCRSPDDARSVFDKMPRRDVVSWNGMIAAYAQNGCGKEALELFQKMKLDRVKPNRVTFMCVLDAFASPEDLEQGQWIHASIVDGGFEADVFVGTALITMYGKCGRPDDARSVFDKIPLRDVVSWNAMIAAYAQNGCGKEALELFELMYLQRMRPDRITFICILDACASLAALTQGQEVHNSIVDGGFETELVVGNALLNMYGKCGSPNDARSVFDKMPQRDVVSWNAMIAAYAQNEHSYEALELFRQMDLEGMEPNKITFISVLEACASPEMLVQGQDIHARIVDSGFETDVFVGNAIINMYGKCGSLNDARSIFDTMPRRDVVSWTAMIAAYAHAPNGHGKEALDLFRQMDLEGVKPNKITFLCIFGACASSANLAQVQEVHASIADCEFKKDVIVGTALITMYGKCGSPDDARSIFDKMHQRDVVSWNAMIAAYAQNGRGKDAFELFRRMDLEGVKADVVTFVCLLDVCANLAALAQGQGFHASIIDGGFNTNMTVRNALVNMYGKCGSPDDARSVFDMMPQRDVISWNAMIAAYAQNGRGKEAQELFQQMDLEAVKPNKITFISILFACSHAGMLDDGWQYVVAMSRDHAIIPTPEHYVCMLDLIGRAGQLDEAEDLINMSFQPDAVAWRAFLGACRIHGDVERGACAAKCIFQLDPKDAAPYILLSNIYAAAGRQDDVTKVRQAMEEWV